MSKKEKVVWVTTNDIDRMCDNVREFVHDCPYCNVEIKYQLSNGELLDVVMSSIFIKCPHCQTEYHLSWGGGHPSCDKNEEDFETLFGNE